MCEICGLPLQVGKIHYDHIVPDQLGGEATLDNCQAVCVGCHKDKTREDVGRIAKAKRQERKHIGVKRRSGFRGWRKMNGEIVWSKDRS